ncbi:MAG TPA: TlpA disulfide reductase family protein [Bryobacteraceae bacterium]|nr:TlpA disulfide reductase family protein [Bryobacteraceae bacterium]
MKDKAPDRAGQAILAVMVVLGVALAWVIVNSMRDRVVQVGDTAPNFSITTDSGQTVSLANYRGKVLVLNFWASWCPPCIAETPSLNKFQQEVAGSGVTVLAISIDRNKKMYDRFLRRFGVSFETALDPTAKISASYGTYKIPETYIIDRNGKVAEKIISDRNWTDPQIVNFVKTL